LDNYSEAMRARICSLDPEVASRTIRHCFNTLMSTARE
jgi:hypothetical protein